MGWMVGWLAVHGGGNDAQRSLVSFKQLFFPICVMDPSVGIFFISAFRLCVYYKVFFFCQFIHEGL